MKRIFLLGLDCATPQLVFDQYYDRLPNLSKLISHGICGNLETTVPPVTVPAWMSMMTGLDPGQLGFFGFTDRADYSYDNNYIVTHKSLSRDALWDHVGKKGYKSIVFNVPLTYPPRAIDGIMVSSFLTPDKELVYATPSNIQEELDEIADGDYIIDVSNFRTTDKEKLLEEIYEMTRRRFKILTNYVKKKEWNMFLSVEMGIDRLHHGFWRYAHSDEDARYQNVLIDYYMFIDTLIGELVEAFPEDTQLMITSDHGAKTLQGTFCINDWLISKGYLVVEDSNHKGRLNPNKVNWKKTRVWGSGGYYCKLYFNVKDREPEGILEYSEINEITNEIIHELSGLCDLDGNPITNDYFLPKDSYEEVNGIPPDMMVYIGQLDWRVTGNIGNDHLFLFEDTAIDNANHDKNGIVIFNSNPKVSLAQEDCLSKENLQINQYQMIDVAPTILKYFDIPKPDTMKGQNINIE